MTDERSEAVVVEELELISQYLNEELDPARSAEVHKRLTEDRDFLSLAAPLLFAWNAMRKGRPRPPGEAEKHWDEFTRRAGFVHQKKRMYRRWFIIGAIVALITVPALVMRGEIATAWRDWRDFVNVPADTGWISLRPNIEVALAPGARLRTARQHDPDRHRAQLRGSARFRVGPGDQNVPLENMVPLAVRTRAGNIVAGLGEFSVTVNGDTAIVEVHVPERRYLYGSIELPSMVAVGRDVQSVPTTVKESQVARLVRGQAPEIIR